MSDYLTCVYHGNKIHVRVTRDLIYCSNKCSKHLKPDSKCKLTRCILDYPVITYLHTTQSGKSIRTPQCKALKPICYIHK
jgi:hypothetical protein